jgi:peptidoglycan hydrolase FlgJ
MISPLAPAPPKPSALAKAELRPAAQKFEAVFLRELIGSMRKAKLADEVFGSGATDSFREMADARTADAMASLDQFGIARLIEKQFAVSEKQND